MPLWAARFAWIWLGNYACRVGSRGENTRIISAKFTQTLLPKVSFPLQFFVNLWLGSTFFSSFQKRKETFKKSLNLMTTLNLNNFVTTEETPFVRLKALHIVTQGDTMLNLAIKKKFRMRAVCVPFSQTGCLPTGRFSAFSLKLRLKSTKQNTLVRGLWTGFLWIWKQAVF